MTSPAFPRVARPRILGALPPGAHAVIEASAGTGKTFTLEHLVIDLVLAGIPIEAILVVTFTDKATSELKDRVRARLATLAAVAAGRLPAPSPPADGTVWTLDAEARARLQQALADADRAPISTIHGFCQRVLAEHAFAGRRLLDEQQVDARAALAEALGEALRHELGVDPAHRSWLEAWLAQGGTPAGLADQLAAALTARERPDGLFDEPRLEEALAGAAALDPALVSGWLQRGKLPRASKRDPRAELERLWTQLVRAHEAGAAGRLQLVTQVAKRDPFDATVRRWLAGGYPSPALVEALTAVDAALPTLDEALVARALPIVGARLAARKRALGLYDFDDMLGLVAEALDGPAGEPLAAELRRRYQVALVDEFQDTDPVQWRIFERIFFESRDPVRPLYLVGDPKQSIYAFRGADVSTYLEARRTVRAAGGAVVALDQSWRSSPAMMGALNALFDGAAAAPFFDPALGITYDRPVHAAKTELGAVDAAGRSAAPLTLVELPEGAAALRKSAWGRFIVDEIGRLLHGGLRVGPRGAERPVEPRDVFVLTTSNSEAAAIGRQLGAAGIPHALYKQEGLFQTAEAREVLEVLQALAEPHRRDRRARALAGRFFAVPLEGLATVEELPAGHPIAERFAHLRALAQAGDLPGLFAALVDDTGFGRRCLAALDGERALTTVQQLFELLLEEARGGRVPLGELAARLGAWTRGEGRPAAAGVDGGNALRVASDEQAVQVLTMHKSKGLEAEVVFLYGGLHQNHAKSSRQYHDGTRRRLAIGKVRRAAVKDAVERDERGGRARLLYVALTRAKSRVYVPRLEKGSGLWKEAAPCLERLVGRPDVEVRRAPAPGEAEAALAADPDDSDEAPASPGGDALAWVDPGEAARVRAGELARLGAALAPLPAAPVEAAGGAPRWEQLRDARAGALVTSYSRLKGQAAARSEAFDEAPPEAAAPGRPAGPPEGALPGGAATGVFLHELLERVDLGAFATPLALDAFRARPEVARLFDELLARHRIDARHRGEAERLVWAAYSTPVDGCAPAGLGAPAGARELELLYPHPGGRAFIRGVLDYVVELDGAVWVVDWKSDWLGRWDAAALDAHVEAHYALQARLYALGVARAVGPARVGGLVYAFLRAPEAPAFWTRRLDGDVLGRWEHDFAALALGPDAGALDRPDQPDRPDARGGPR